MSGMLLAQPFRRISRPYTLLVLAHPGERNKPRIYLAYYTRGKASPAQQYHVAIIARVHPFDDKSDNTLRLHAVNTLVRPSPTSDVEEVWSFQAVRENFFSHRLAGVIYLGKLPAGRTCEDMETLCARVKVPRHGEGGWRCKDWVWDALDVSGYRLLQLISSIFSSQN